MFPASVRVDTGAGIVSATGTEVVKGIMETVLDCVRVRKEIILRKFISFLN